MKSWLKMIAGIAVMGLVAYAVEHYLSPLPHVAWDVLMTTPIDQLTLLIEAAVMFIVAGGFVVQQFFHHMRASGIVGHATESKESRWSDLLFLFVAIFGSAALYAGFIKLSRLAQ